MPRIYVSNYVRACVCRLAFESSAEISRPWVTKRNTEKHQTHDSAYVYCMDSHMRPSHMCTAGIAILQPRVAYTSRKCVACTCTADTRNLSTCAACTHCNVLCAHVLLVHVLLVHVLPACVLLMHVLPVHVPHDGSMQAGRFASGRKLRAKLHKPLQMKQPQVWYEKLEEA